MRRIQQVLYVEDEADIREMTEFALEDEEFELVLCCSGQEALQKANNLKPDLILMDMMMPGMDGLTTVQKMQEIPHLSNIPVIFMTAKVSSAEQEKYQAFGAIGVISKPFDAMSLPDQIRDILEQNLEYSGG